MHVEAPNLSRCHRERTARRDGRMAGRPLSAPDSRRRRVEDPLSGMRRAATRGTVSYQRAMAAAAALLD